MDATNHSLACGCHGLGGALSGIGALPKSVTALKSLNSYSNWGMWGMDVTNHSLACSCHGLGGALCSIGALPQV